MKNKKVKLTAGIIALLLVAGALAYYSSTMSIDNPFNTQKYGGEIVEKFTPEKDWEPGEEITKEVQAKNTGDYDLFVRVKMSEKWERNSTPFFNCDSSEKDKFFPVSSENAVAEGSSVYKNIVNNQDWELKEDGYFYYKKVLKGNTPTSKLLESVTLCKDANMGTYVTSNVKYALVDKDTTQDQLKDSDYNLTTLPDTIPEGKVVYQKVTTSLSDSDKGLADANYTLTITTEIVQANEDAAQGWKLIPTK